MSWKDRIPAEKLKKLLPFFFLLWGLFSVFTLQRDFHHITRLSIFVLLIGPSFMAFALLTRFLEGLTDESRFSRYRNLARQANLSATQILAQYILIFCLPFYVIKESWVYLAINVLLLATILWDPVYEKLIHSALYRHLVLSWAMISACSFLFPFVLPDYIAWFYPALAFISVLAFLPTRKEGRYFILLAALWGMTVVPLLVLPSAYRFPILSVWAKDPHFTWDMQGRESKDEPLAKSMSEAYLKDSLGEGHTLCCVAPVVAPPRLSTSVYQEWTLGDTIIESRELKTRIKGNAAQQAFHSFFCKRNFPLSGQDASLRCRIKIGETIDIGGTAIHISVE